MAAIYDSEGLYLAQGLQGSAVCDAAIQLARRLAAARGEVVYMEDAGAWSSVSPDGEWVEMDDADLHAIGLGE